MTKAIDQYGGLAGYHETTQKLRSFFFARGFVEVDTQSRLSILAACEDPTTIATFTLSGVKWPLPQTGQMWLEHELLRNPHVPGFFCATTSYRDEPNPIHGRHLKMFPLFEFETHGDMDVLQDLMADLFQYLGFGDKKTYQDGNYADVAQKYGEAHVEADQEELIQKDFGNVFFLKNFPWYTHPFFNMKKSGEVANKIDAILYGVETVGSAERSCNTDEMYELFHTISDGQYAATLYKHFGKERVNKELKVFLNLDFIPRCGGGIGVSRLMRALELAQQETEQVPVHKTVGGAVRAEL